MRDFSITISFKTICNFFLLTLGFGIAVFALTESQISLVGLAHFGDFLGGIFGATIGLATLYLVFNEFHESRIKNSFDNAFKVFEEYRDHLIKLEANILFTRILPGGGVNSYKGNLAITKLRFCPMYARDDRGAQELLQSILEYSESLADLSEILSEHKLIWRLLNGRFKDIASEIYLLQRDVLDPKYSAGIAENLSILRSIGASCGRFHSIIKGECFL
jgi:hypothetical protein